MLFQDTCWFKQQQNKIYFWNNTRPVFLFPVSIEPNNFLWLGLSASSSATSWHNEYAIMLTESQLVPKIGTNTIWALDGCTFRIYHKLHTSEWAPLSETANLVWMSAFSNGCLLWQHPSVWIVLSTCHCSFIENKWQFNLLHTYMRLTWRVVTPGPISSIYFVLCVTTVWSKSGKNYFFADMAVSTASSVCSSGL